MRQDEVDVTFSEDEIRSILAYIADGSVVKCNRCNSRNQWEHRREPTDAKVHYMSCHVCNRRMERGVLKFIEEYEANQPEVELDEDEHMMLSACALSPEQVATINYAENFCGYCGKQNLKVVTTSGYSYLNCEDCDKPFNAYEVKFFDTPKGPSDFGDFYDTSTPEWEDKNKVGGKYMAGVLEDFLPALKEVAQLGSMNNKPNGKYERGSWMLVENAEQLYLDAFWRHINDGRHNIDPETGMPHDVAIAWNALALVWFRLKREGKVK